MLPIGEWSNYFNQIPMIFQLAMSDSCWFCFVTHPIKSHWLPLKNLGKKKKKHQYHQIPESQTFPFCIATSLFMSCVLKKISSNPMRIPIKCHKIPIERIPALAAKHRLKQRPKLRLEHEGLGGETSRSERIVRSDEFAPAHRASQMSCLLWFQYRIWYIY